MNTSAEVLEFEALRPSLLGRYVFQPAGPAASWRRSQPHADRDAARRRPGRSRRSRRIPARWPRARSPPRAARPSASISAACRMSKPPSTSCASKAPASSPRKSSISSRCSTAPPTPNRCSPPPPSASRGSAGAPRPSAISARCCKTWKARSCPMAASPTTPAWRSARLRRDIERQKKAIQESLERFLRAHREEGVLQEEFVTIRNERFVVPVIAGQRRKLDGVIHGASSSGHTLFVEPLETIDLNNELVRLAEEEAREVHRILLEMTDRLRGYGDSIRQTLATMAELELIFAKAPLRRRVRLRHPALRRAPAAEGRAPSAARRRAAARAARRPCRSRLELTARPPHAAHQRPQHRRQNGHAEDRGPAQPDGASGPAGARRRGRVPALRAGAGRYRRLPVHPGKPQHVFRARLATSARWRWT